MVTVVVNPTEVTLRYALTFLDQNRIQIINSRQEVIGQMNIVSPYVFSVTDFETVVTTGAQESVDSVANDDDKSAIVADVIRTLLAQFNWVLEPEFEKEYM